MISDLYSWLTVALTALALAALRVMRRHAPGVPASHSARLVTRAVVALLVGCWILGYPLGVAAVRAPLTAGYHPLRSADDAGGAKTVVVLAGGVRTFDVGPRSLSALSADTALRVLEAARVAALLGPDTLVIASGGGNFELQSRSEAEAMRDALVSLGVPRDCIAVEPRSHNTRQQALELATLLTRMHVTDFVLVTSGWHLRRLVAAFRAVGFDPIPSAAQHDPDRRGSRWHLLPTVGELDASSDALREYLALACTTGCAAGSHSGYPEPAP